MDAILFYDGDCGFCNSMVNFVLKHERDRTIYFCSLQSEKAVQILKYHGLVTIDPETLYFLKKNRVFDRSAAVLEVCRHLKWYYRWLRIFKIAPGSLRDFLYNIVAKRRRSLMKDQCVVPKAHEKERFIQ